MLTCEIFSNIPQKLVATVSQLTCLTFLELLHPCGGAAFASEGVIEHEGHQLPQLVADARLVKPGTTLPAHQLHAAEIPQFPANCIKNDSVLRNIRATN